MTTELVLDGTASERPAPPPARATEAVSTVATRLSFVVVAWLLLTQTPSWTMAALMLTLQALGYLASAAGTAWLLDRLDADRLAVGAELLSALALAGVAFGHPNRTGLAVLLVVLGGARAAAELSQAVRSGPAPDVEAAHASTRPRAILVGAGMLALGAAAGAAAAWLGPVGTLWLLAMVCAGCAAAVVRTGSSPATLAPIDQPDEDSPTLTPFWRSALARRLGLALFTTGLFASAGVVILGVVWARDVFGSVNGLSAAADRVGELAVDRLAADGLGVAGGAVVVGAVGAAAVFTAAAVRPGPFFLSGLGYLAGGGAVAILAGVPATQLLVIVIGLLLGVALASVTPVVGLVLGEQVPAARRGRVGALALAVAAVAAAAGAWLGAWLAAGVPAEIAVAAAAGCVLVAMLVPVFAPRTWQRTVPAGDAPVTVLRRTARLTGRLAVTLAYTDGEWLVEVRRGRALLGSRHVVRPADALNMLAMLNVPTLSHSVESALATDQAEASRQVDRVRVELAELEAKLSGLKEMVVLTEERTEP
jgi:hypothetical protein